MTEDRPRLLKEAHELRVQCHVCAMGRTPCNDSRDTLVFLDSSAKIAWVSQQVPGIPLCEVVGRSTYENIHEDHIERSRQVIEDALASGNKATLIHKDRYEGRYWLIYLTPLYHGDIAIVAQTQSFCDGVFTLSEMQRKVVRLVGMGFSTEQIAELHNISANTVNTHLRRASESFGVGRCLLSSWACRMATVLGVKNLDKWK